MRNDRLIAVAAASRAHADLKSLEQASGTVGGNILLDEIEHFFISYNTIKGKQFNPLGRFGPERAEALVREGAKRFQAK